MGPKSGRRQDPPADERSGAHLALFPEARQGVRVGKDGERKKTRTDHFEAVQMKICRWARNEQLAGKDISGDDRMDEYIAEMEGDEHRLSTKLEPLGEVEKTWLVMVTDRLKALEKKQNRCQHQARLIFKTCFDCGSSEW